MSLSSLAIQLRVLPLFLQTLRYLLEDTLKFARIMEGLGVELLRSLMTLIAFLPILWGLSKQITMLPFFGEVNHALVWVAIISALGGTILLAAVGFKLPG